MTPITENKNPKALVAMSGGVDSSVAALLMKEAGFRCVGCTMKLFEGEDDGENGKTCCTADDAEDARSVARKLSMDFYVFNYKEEFRKNVIAPFCSRYLSGETPNPCIDCNRYLKFDALYERARLLGCEKVVTGHYAKIDFVDGRFVLRKASDETKDQSYVLYRLTEEMLAHTAFPLGELTKDEVRKIALRNNFINAKKHDSQDICFVPDGDYAPVVERYAGVVSRPGPFVDTKGNVLGTHKGIIHYTVGQRRGLGIAYSESLYVVRIEPETNTVVLGTLPEIYRRSVTVRNFHWISGKAPEGPFRANVRTRYHKPEAPATVTILPENRAEIVFDEPQRALSPGQAAVLYSGDIVLGGGEMEREGKIIE